MKRARYYYNASLLHLRKKNNTITGPLLQAVVLVLGAFAFPFFQQQEIESTAWKEKKEQHVASFSREISRSIFFRDMLSKTMCQLELLKDIDTTNPAAQEKVNFHVTMLSHSYNNLVDSHQPHDAIIQLTPLYFGNKTSSKVMSLKKQIEELENPALCQLIDNTCDCSELDSRINTAYEAYDLSIDYMIHDLQYGD